MDSTVYVSLDSLDDAETEIIRLESSLPPIPNIEELMPAEYLIQEENKEKEARIEAYSKLPKGQDIPEDLFKLLVDMKKKIIDQQTSKRKRGAWNVIFLEYLHSQLDYLFQRASRCICSSDANLRPSSQVDHYTDKSMNRSGVSSNNQAATSTISDRVDSSELLVQDSSVHLDSVDDVEKEVEKLAASLPPRPKYEKVKAVEYLIKEVDKKKEARTEAYSKVPKGQDVPEELFKVMVRMQKSIIDHQASVRNREAWNVIYLEQLHSRFDGLLDKSSRCIRSSPVASLEPSSVPARTNHVM